MPQAKAVDTACQVHVVLQGCKSYFGIAHVVIERRLPIPMLVTLGNRTLVWIILKEVDYSSEKKGFFTDEVVKLPSWKILPYIYIIRR